LAELRVCFVGSTRLAEALAASCVLTVLEPDGWQGDLRDRTPDFVLVEGCERTEPGWDGQIGALLGSCGRAAIPRLLWITSDPPDPALLARCKDFERVFTVDRGQVSALTEAGAVAPSPLWEATSLESGPVEVDREERPDPVVWLGGWRREWPEQWRQHLVAVLRGAAAAGLTIVPVSAIDGLPNDLRPHLAGGGGEDRLRVLRRARVVIGADPEVGSAHTAPSVVFDAIACGAAVITPHAFTYYAAFSARVDGELRHFIPYVYDAESTAEAAERFLTDGALREEAVSRCRQIVAHNHTYAHRLATLASAAGLSLLPDGHPSSASD
jgi:hypothetical protein